MSSTSNATAPLQRSARPRIKQPQGGPDHSTAVAMLNKVPQVTLAFWVIKIMATTVGETAADFLSSNLGLGLTNTTILMATLLAGALAAQFTVRRYIPSIYWLAVVLISVVGTLITDNLVDNLGVSLVTTTIGFGIAMFVTFGLWYRSEKTLSIHTIVTRKREAFYWSAILFTFALGTAAGDLIAEHFALGYWKSALLFGGLIAIIAALRSARRLGEISAFWMAYVLTRPLGASIGDFLTQPRDNGGLGIGSNAVTALFLTTIIGLVIYFSIQQRKDEATAAIDVIV